MKVCTDITEGATRLVKQQGGFYKKDDEGLRFMLTFTPENDYDKDLLLRLSEAVWHPLEDISNSEGPPCYGLSFDIARKQDIEVVERTDR